MAGSTSVAKWAQCGQVNEAYSITVTGASAWPSTRSSGTTVTGSCGASANDWPPEGTDPFVVLAAGRNSITATPATAAMAMIPNAINIFRMIASIDTTYSASASLPST